MDNNKHEDEETRYVSDEELKDMSEAFKKRLNATGNSSLLHDFSLLEDKRAIKLSECRELSDRDALMPSMKNRRGLETALKSEIARADRANYGIKPGEPLRYLFSLAEIDFNDLGPVNNTYGHPEGDNFLRFLESSFKEITPRAEDIIGRWGGDEIVLLLSQPILPGRDPESASPENVKNRILIPLRDRFYEKTKERLSELKDETGKPLIINGIEVDRRGIGLSIGITNYPLLSKSHLDIVSDVDETMYRAKALKNKPSDSEGNYKGHIKIYDKP